MEIKPPLGVSPHWFVHRQRIRELNEAIGRFIGYIEANIHIEEHSERYEVIAAWAQEIESLALLEADLSRKRSKYQ